MHLEPQSWCACCVLGPPGVRILSSRRHVQVEPQSWCSGASNRWCGEQCHSAAAGAAAVSTAVQATAAAGAAAVSTAVQHGRHEFFIGCEFFIGWHGPRTMSCTAHPSRPNAHHATPVSPWHTTERLGQVRATAPSASSRGHAHWEKGLWQDHETRGARHTLALHALPCPPGH